MLADGVLKRAHLIELGRRQLHHGLCITSPAVEAFLRNRIEEGVEAVEILLLDGVVFMIVAARAAHSGTEPHDRRRLQAVHYVLVLILLRDRTALKINHVVAIE